MPPRVPPTLLVLLVLCGAPLLPGCQRPGADDAADDAATANVALEEEPLLVRAAAVARGPIESRVRSTANVVSLDVVDVVPERTDPVVAIFVEQGDSVVAGQELARLRTDDAELALHEAEVRLMEAQAELARAQRDHDRNQRLYAEAQAGGARLISERELETSQQALETARAAAAAAQVALERARHELEHCTLRSPIAGVVAERDLSLGDMATIGQRAFQIVDLDHPKVVLYRPQRELPLLRVGQELVATSEALPGCRIPGRIERISPVIDPDTGTFEVTAALEPPAERTLPVGLLVEVDLVLERHEDALLVPKEALVHDGDEVAVFVVRDGRAHRVVLRPGFEDAEHIEALPGTDLREGELVVVIGTDRLHDGDPVEVAGEE